MKKISFAVLSVGTFSLLFASHTTASEDLDKKIAEIEDEYNVYIDQNDSDFGTASNSVDSFTNLEELEEVAQLIQALSETGETEQTNVPSEGSNEDDFSPMSSFQNVGATTTIDITISPDTLEQSLEIPINLEIIYDYNSEASSPAAGDRFTDIGNIGASAFGVTAVNWEHDRGDFDYVSSGGDSQGNALVTTTGEWVADGDLGDFGGSVNAQVRSQFTSYNSVVSP